MDKSLVTQLIRKNCLLKTDWGRRILLAMEVGEFSEADKLLTGMCVYPRHADVLIFKSLVEQDKIEEAAQKLVDIGDNHKKILKDFLRGV